MTYASSREQQAGRFKPSVPPTSYNTHNPLHCLPSIYPTTLLTPTATPGISNISTNSIRPAAGVRRRRSSTAPSAAARKPSLRAPTTTTPTSRTQCQYPLISCLLRPEGQWSGRHEHCRTREQPTQPPRPWLYRPLRVAVSRSMPVSFPTQHELSIPFHFCRALLSTLPTDTCRYRPRCRPKYAHLSPPIRPPLPCKNTDTPPIHFTSEHRLKGPPRISNRHKRRYHARQ